MTGRAWTIIDDTAGRPLTVNAVAKMHRQTWAKATREARQRWHLLTLAARVPRLHAALVIAQPMHRDRRSPQDVAACAPAVKAAIDGLVDAKVLPDDDPQHLLEVRFRAPDVCGVDGLRLRVIEVQA